MAHVAFALRCEIRHYLCQTPQTTTARAEVLTLGKLIVLSAAKISATRMAAVFMISLATIWLKTGLMPRWLLVISCMVALAFADRQRREHVADPGVSTD